MAPSKQKLLKKKPSVTGLSRNRGLRLLKRNLRKEGFAWEPVAILPPEIATMCLQYALPSSTSNDYPLRLLDLTNVSRRWESFLFSTPTFWTTIHVKYRAHDLLAIIALFAHLSGQAAMKLVVWNDLGCEWDAIKSLLLPYAHRISGITLGNDPPIYSDSPFRDMGYISLVTNIVKSFGWLPSLSEIHFGRGLELRPSQLTVLDLPSNARVMNSIEVSLQNEAIGSLFLTPVVVNGASDDLWIWMDGDERRVRSEFVLKNALGDVDDRSTTIIAINSGISSLTDVLNLLDNQSTSTNTLSNSPCANFISGNRCLLCGSEKGTLLRVLGCVRSHFEVRPFQCSGCRLCSTVNGYARFYTSQQLSNHRSHSCAICGTQTSRALGMEPDEETVCDGCKPPNIEEVLRLHEECKRMWRETYNALSVTTDITVTDVNLWKALYAEAMQYMIPIIMGMGLYFQTRREKTELEAVIQRSVLLLIQRRFLRTVPLVPIQGLEEMIRFFSPRFQEFQEQIGRIAGLPPALLHLVKPSEVAFMKLGGILPTHQVIRDSDYSPLDIGTSWGVLQISPDRLSWPRIYENGSTVG